jgi:hypothetical protein
MMQLLLRQASAQHQLSLLQQAVHCRTADNSSSNRSSSGQMLHHQLTAHISRAQTQLQVVMAAAVPGLVASSAE